MRKVHQLLLPVLLFTTILTAQGQTNYQPGSVLLKNGQQVNGLIDYREWRQNPRTINFKKDAGAQVAQYGVEDLTGFTINNQDSFERAVVTKDMRPVELRELIDQSQVSSDTAEIKQVDTVFLRILSKGGKAELYELVDIKPHYYIREQGDYKELQYKVYYSTGTSGLSYSYTFRNQLQQYAYGHKEESKLYRLLEKAEYNEHDLMRVIATVNNVQFTQKKKTPPQFFVAAGPAYSNMKVEGPTKAAGLDYSGNLGFAAGVGMDIVSERSLQAFIIRLEVFYSSLKYEGKSATATYTVKQNNITPALNLLYSFLRKPACKAYVGAGIQYNFSSYPDNVYVTKGNENNPEKDFLDFEKSWLSVPVRIGGTFKKIDVSLLANVAGAFETFSFISVKPSIYSLRIGYRLTR
ncbi:MAG: hypothetical protein J7621_27755 [Niastella sp.]|nr:hypothetical protein [Niastella sp.]